MLWALPLLFGSTAQAMATRNPQSSRRFASSMRGSYQPGVLRTMARNGRDFALQCQRFAVTDEFGQQHGTHPWLVWVAGDQQYRDSSSMVGFRSCLLCRSTAIWHRSSRVWFRRSMSRCEPVSAMGWPMETAGLGWTPSRHSPTLGEEVDRPGYWRSCP